MTTKNKKGFTLAEVLITLGIIGVVAALTIPTLVQNYQTKAWATASQVFEAKFTEALKTMNVQGKLGKYGKYDSTEGFVEELQKHFKTTKVCDKDHLMQCFEKTVTWGDKDADLSNIKESKDFVQLAEGESDWGTNVMGIQFANGVTGLIAYNPNCKSDPYDNKVTGSDCYAMVYDTSGFANPNELGKDLISTPNVKNLALGGCLAKINEICITKLVFDSTSVSYEECEANKGTWGIQKCAVDNDTYGGDYWAGAVKQCGHISKLPTMAQLAEIANYVYNTSGIDPLGSAYDVSLDTSRFSELGISSVGSGFTLWSGEESNEYMARGREFGTNGTYFNSNSRTYSPKKVFCIGD